MAVGAGVAVASGVGVATGMAVDSEVGPGKGVTVGLKTILAARHVLIMAHGSHKTAAVRAMVEGSRHAPCPASFLQGHPDAQVFLDEAAAATLHPDT